MERRSEASDNDPDESLLSVSVDDLGSDALLSQDPTGGRAEQKEQKTCEYDRLDTNYQVPDIVLETTEVLNDSSESGENETNSSRNDDGQPPSDNGEGDSSSERLRTLSESSQKKDDEDLSLETSDIFPHLEGVPDAKTMNVEIRKSSFQNTTRLQLIAFPVDMQDMNNDNMASALKRCLNFTLRFSKMYKGDTSDFVGFLHLMFRTFEETQLAKNDLERVRSSLTVRPADTDSTSFKAEWNQILGLVIPNSLSERAESTVYIHNLPHDVSHDEVAKLFPDAKSVAVIPEDKKRTDRGRHAWINFPNPESSRYALKSNVFKSRGRKLQVFHYADYAHFVNDPGVNSRRKIAAADSSKTSTPKPKHTMANEKTVSTTDDKVESHAKSTREKRKVADKDQGRSPRRSHSTDRASSSKVSQGRHLTPPRRMSPDSRRSPAPENDVSTSATAGRRRNKGKQKKRKNKSRAKMASSSFALSKKIMQRNLNRQRIKARRQAGTRTGDVVAFMNNLSGQETSKTPKSIPSLLSVDFQPAPSLMSRNLCSIRNGLPRENQRIRLGVSSSMSARHREPLSSSRHLSRHSSNRTDSLAKYSASYTSQTGRDLAMPRQPRVRTYSRDYGQHSSAAREDVRGLREHVNESMSIRGSSRGSPVRIRERPREPSGYTESLDARDYATYPRDSSRDSRDLYRLARDHNEQRDSYRGSRPVGPSSGSHSREPAPVHHRKDRHDPRETVRAARELEPRSYASTLPDLPSGSRDHARDLKDSRSSRYLSREFGRTSSSPGTRHGTMDLGHARDTHVSHEKSRRLKSAAAYSSADASSSSRHDSRPRRFGSTSPESKTHSRKAAYSSSASGSSKHRPSDHDRHRDGSSRQTKRRSSESISHHHGKRTRTDDGRNDRNSYK